MSCALLGDFDLAGHDVAIGGVRRSLRPAAVGSEHQFFFSGVDVAGQVAAVGLDHPEGGVAEELGVVARERLQVGLRLLLGAHRGCPSVRAAAAGHDPRQSRTRLSPRLTGCLRAGGRRQLAR